MPNLSFAPDVEDVATVVRQQTGDSHRDAEGRPFIRSLMMGELSIADYTRYLAQLARVYEALEARHPVISGSDLFDSRLNRGPSIRNDLAALDASDWRVTHPALPATDAYVLRLHEVAGDPVRYLAHHYTRYLGDLSGGQAIARLVARHYGASEQTLSFYRFEGIGDTVHYKRAYRSGLNELQLDATDAQDLVDEVNRAFALNAALFDELAAGGSA